MPKIVKWIPWLSSEAQVAKSIVQAGNQGQRYWLEDCLGLDSRSLLQLDPSRDTWAEETYKDCTRWFEAGDERMRSSHNSISPYFGNGGHQNHATDEFLQKLVEDPTAAQGLPALACTRANCTSCFATTSLGCIIEEMSATSPTFPGKSESHVLADSKTQRCRRKLLHLLNH